jgi:uroporphyrinogen decarboxylase
MINLSELDNNQKTSLANSAFLKSCRGESTDHKPIWLMRQAGRYQKEFQNIRKKVSLLELCKRPDLVSEVTLLPVQQLNVDAAIIFADILLPLDAMGAGLSYVEGKGPVIENAVSSLADMANLKTIEPNDLNYVMDAIKLTRQNLKADIPLIGFAGAPFTLVSYLVEGGSTRDFKKTKLFMYKQSDVFHALMETISEFTWRYLNEQINAGVQAIQLFDSWVGCLSPSDYKQFVLPYSKKIFDNVKKSTTSISHIPAIHFATSSYGLLELMREAGGDVFGVDWRAPIDNAWQKIGHDRAIQGNLDPHVLFADKKMILEKTKEILRATKDKHGHIFNLGHGVLPATSVDNVKYLVEIVHDLGGNK